MQQDVGRYLLFTAQQQLQQPDKGLSAQLHALRLRCALQSESLQSSHAQQHLWSQLSLDCSALLAAAGAHQQVAAGR